LIQPRKLNENYEGFGLWQTHTLFDHSVVEFWFIKTYH